MSLYGLLIQLEQLLSRLSDRLHRRKWRRLISVPLTNIGCLLFAHQHRACGELANAHKHGVRRRSVTISEKQVQRIGIYVRTFISGGQDSAALRAKVQAILINLVVNQLDTKRIPSED